MPSQTSRGERIAVFVFGVIFVATLGAISFFVPSPTAFQYTVFRIVLAAAVAGVGAFIPGFIHVEINKGLRASGAMAIFIVVYFFSPAQLVSQPNVPQLGAELDFQTESVIVKDDTKTKIFFTIWNRHPFSKIRVTNIELTELNRIPTELYCCPETRTPLRLEFGATTKQKANAPLPLTTYEIPPLSSHSFVATVEVVRGFADNNPIVWYGIVAHYSTPAAAALVRPSDKVFVANYHEASSLSFTKDELRARLKTDDFFSKSISEQVLAWFAPRQSPSSAVVEANHREKE